jgi:hypothetical protein
MDLHSISWRSVLATSTTALLATVAVLSYSLELKRALYRPSNDLSQDITVGIGGLGGDFEQGPSTGEGRALGFGNPGQLQKGYFAVPSQLQSYEPSETDKVAFLEETACWVAATNAGLSSEEAPSPSLDIAILCQSQP